MWSQTSRALRADERTYLACARTTGQRLARLTAVNAAPWRGAASSPSHRTSRPSCLRRPSAACDRRRPLRLLLGLASGARPRRRLRELRPRASALGLGFSVGRRPRRPQGVPASSILGQRVQRRLRSGLELRCFGSRPSGSTSRRRFGGVWGLRGLRRLKLVFGAHRFFPVAAWPRYETRGSELAELVTDHRLRDEDRDVLAPVMDGDRVPDHLGEDRRRPRPGLQHPLIARGVHRLDRAP